MRKFTVFILVLVLICGIGFIFLKKGIEKVTQENIKRVELTFKEDVKSLEKAGWYANLQISPEQVKIPFTEALKLIFSHEGKIYVKNIEITLLSRTGDKIHSLIKKAYFKAVPQELVPVKFENIEVDGSFSKGIIKVEYHSDSFNFRISSPQNFQVLETIINKINLNLYSKNKGEFFNLKLNAPQGLLSYKVLNAKDAESAIKIIKKLEPNSNILLITYAILGKSIFDIEYLSKTMKKEEVNLEFSKIKYEQKLIKLANKNFNYKIGMNLVLEKLKLDEKNVQNINKLLPLKFNTNIGINNITENIINAIIHFMYSIQKTNTETQLPELLTILSTIITEITTNPPYMVLSFNLNPNDIFNIDFQVKLEIEKMKNLNISGNYIIKNCEEFKKEMMILSKENREQIDALKSENGICKGTFYKTIPLGNLFRSKLQIPIR